jgi:glycosyltransferase involved in cell wall biosynthesis
MRVLIDCTQVSRTKAGVGVYAENMVRELTLLDSGIKWFILVQDDDPDLDFSGCSDVTLIRVSGKIFRKLPFRFLLEQLFIPLLALRYRINVIHSLHYSFPLVPMFSKKVVTIHDMTMFLMPDMHMASKVRYFRFFIGAAARRADALSFVSQSTQKDFLKFFPHPAPSCNVVRLGKGPQFRPDINPQEVERVVRKYGLAQPYVLYIGTIEPRKNLVRLVEAFSTLTQTYPTHTLVIAGMKGWMYESLFELVGTLDLESRVVFTGFVSEEDKPYLIRGAEIFTYVSLYEGFGIPVLEALACGTPTLTSDVSSIPEIAGDSALLIDPSSVQEIATGLERLLGDVSLRNELAAKSISQAARFSWPDTAADMLRVYRKAAGH